MLKLDREIVNKWFEKYNQNDSASSKEHIEKYQEKDRLNWAQ